MSCEEVGSRRKQQEAIEVEGREKVLAERELRGDSRRGVVRRGWGVGRRRRKAARKEGREEVVGLSLEI